LDIQGFNEPDLGSQSNIKPADAAAAWKKWMEPVSLIIFHFLQYSTDVAF
jgi:hypothetical protein